MTIVVAALLPSFYGSMPVAGGAPVLVDICSASHPLAARWDTHGHGAPARQDPPRGLHCPLCVPVAQAVAYSSSPDIVRLPPDRIIFTTERLRTPAMRTVVTAAAHPRGPPALC
jgi:hypothetical protein